MNSQDDVMKSQEYLALEQMIASANIESDRGCALILSSNLENRLGNLIKRLCINLPKEVEKRLFSGTGSFSTFSSRVDTCYALGQIGEKEYRDLNLIRKIRNEFAHTEGELTFESHSIKSRCSEFNLVKEAETDHPSLVHHFSKPRDKFQILVFSLCLTILDRSEKLSNNRPITPISNSILPKNNTK